MLKINVKQFGEHIFPFFKFCKIKQMGPQMYSTDII